MTGVKSPIGQAKWLRALRRFLAPLRQRSFGFLLAGQTASNIGDFFYLVALPWYVLASHGGVVLLGSVLAAYGIPRTALMAAGGHASDRWRPWTVMMTADCVRAAAVAGLAVAAALGPARAVVLVPIAVVIGAADGFFVPASVAIVPALLTAGDLQAGNALVTGGAQITGLAGPAAGGAVVAFLGPSPAFAVDAASFAVSALTLVGVRGAVRRHQDARSVPAAGTRAPGDEDAAAGSVAAAGDSGRGPTLLGILRSERIAQVMLGVLIAANLGSGGVAEIGLPSLARGPLHAGARGYGFLLAALAGGALVGTLAAGYARPPRRPFVTASIAYVAAAPFLAATPFLVNASGAAAALVVYGSLNSFGNILGITAFQKWARPDILGRLMGGLALASFGIFPVSAALAAFLVRDLGPDSLFLFAAAILALAVLAGLSQRTWREFGARQPSVEMTSAETPQHSAGP